PAPPAATSTANSAPSPVPGTIAVHSAFAPLASTAPQSASLAKDLYRTRTRAPSGTAAASVTSTVHDVAPGSGGDRSIRAKPGPLAPGESSHVAASGNAPENCGGLCTIC